jgi:hypothetical protein
MIPKHVMFVRAVTGEVLMIHHNAILAEIKIAILVYQSQGVKINIKINALIVKVVSYCILIFHAD